LKLRSSKHEDEEISIEQVQEKLRTALSRSLVSGELVNVLLGPRIKTIRCRSDEKASSPCKLDAFSPLKRYASLLNSPPHKLKTQARGHAEAKSSVLQPGESLHMALPRSCRSDEKASSPCKQDSLTMASIVEEKDIDNVNKALLSSDPSEAGREAEPPGCGEANPLIIETPEDVGVDCPSGEPASIIFNSRFRYPGPALQHREALVEPSSTKTESIENSAQVYSAGARRPRPARVGKQAHPVLKRIFGRGFKCLVCLN
jgi:hypothetical protein